MSTVINQGKQSVTERKTAGKPLGHPDFWPVLASAVNEHSASFTCWQRQFEPDSPIQINQYIFEKGVSLYTEEKSGIFAMLGCSGI